MKKIVSLIVVLVLLVTSIISSNIIASATEKYSSKIDSVLAKKLESMNDTKSIGVSVWIEDIDSAEYNNKVESKISEMIEKKEIDNSALEVLELSKATDLDKKVINKINKIDSKLSIKKVNKVISSKRKIAKEMYEENNNSLLSQLLSEKDKEDRLIYLSHYSPNLLLNLNKKQIIQMSKKKIVKEMNFFDREAELVNNSNNYLDDEVLSNSSYSTNDYSFSTYQYETTGIDTMRDVFGYSGEGVKVGIIDFPFANSSEIDYFNDDTFQVYYCGNGGLVNTYSSHGNCVACIIAGNYNNSNSNSSFVGAVPDAKLYVTSGIDFRSALEVLVDNGVDVINCSMLFGGDGDNNYGDTSKWIDHIVSEHNVTFVGASGNSGTTGIGSCQMGYNTITVGATYVTGEIESYSSYINGINTINKPDLVAPGAAFCLPSNRDSSTDVPNSASGTSFAAPVVTGAVAQLCQASPVLASNPKLMKSVLLSGCTLNSYMDEDEFLSVENSNNNMISKNYGAGVLNVLNSYATFFTRQNYVAGTFNSTSSSVSSTMNINAPAGKLIRFSAVWDKSNTISGTHSNGTINSPDIDHCRLCVYTPDNRVYEAVNMYDTKDMLSFVSTGSGEYTVCLVRCGDIVNQNLAYAISASVQSR